MRKSSYPHMYVGFCDVLGFGTSVLRRFDDTVVLYQKVMGELQCLPSRLRARVSVYSDSILVVHEQVWPVLGTICLMHCLFLQWGWLLRGGIAYGRYWESTRHRSLFVVSDALVKAVTIEKTVKVPAVAVSEDIELPLNAWVPRFEHGIFDTPLLHFRGRSIVNPFNAYWFSSAVQRVRQLRSAHPEHKAKYDWFLALADSVKAHDPLVPPSALTELIGLGVISRRAEPRKAIRSKPKR